MMHDKHIRAGTNRFPEDSGGRIECTGDPFYVPVTLDNESYPSQIPLLGKAGRCNVLHEGEELRDIHHYGVCTGDNQRFITMSNTKHL